MLLGGKWDLHHFREVWRSLGKTLVDNAVMKSA
jgi:hypothetical protein